MTRDDEPADAVQKLRRERDMLLARLQLQFERMPIPCVTCDPRLVITDWNPAAERIFGFTRAEAIGRDAQELLTAGPIRVDVSDPRLMDMIPSSYVAANHTKHGALITCEWHTVRLYDVDGKVLGLLSMGEDITARRATESQLHASRLAQADLEHIGRIGSWSWELDSGKLTWSEERYRLLGDEPDGSASVAKFRAQLHPDDIERMWDAIRKAREDHQPYEIAYRAFHKDGSIRHMHAYSRIELDADGSPTRMFGTAQDVTEHILTKQALADELAAMVRLQELSTRLVAEDDSSSLLEEILDAALAITGAEMGNIRLYEADLRTATIVASRNYPVGVVEQYATMDVRLNSPIGTASRFMIEDFEHPTDGPYSPAYLEVSRAMGIRAKQSTPLISRSGQTVGVLSTHYTEPHRFEDRELRVLDMLARQAADWIERRHAKIERERLLAREREAREQAEHAAKLKDNFLATLSHELRAPLTAILAWTELLQMEPEDIAQVRDGLDVIGRNARAQAQLVGDLLDLSRITTGKMRLDTQIVNLVDLTYDAIAGVRPACEAKQIKLSHVVEATLDPIQGDPSRLQQVLWNLLSNAVKFTPERGSVELALSRVGSQVEIRVSDSGVGIPVPFLPHLFERFRQRDASPSRKHGGLGIGLALVKELAELHGGEVSAHSDGEGRGATFVVRLPLAPAPVAQPRTRVITPVRLTTVSNDAAPLGGVRVLLVDDDADTLDVIQRMLQLRGAVVIGAETVDEALRHLDASSFDVVLSDIGMPNRDGFELVAELRRRHINAPAAALTAFAQSDDRARVLASGFRAYIAKPVEASELVATVASLARG
jgi:PAS domain S-box-containing protein